MAQAYSKIIKTTEIGIKQANGLIDIIHANIATVYQDDQRPNRLDYIHGTIRKIIVGGKAYGLDDTAIAFVITSITTTELQLDQVGYLDISEAPPPPGKKDDTTTEDKKE